MKFYLWTEPNQFGLVQNRFGPIKGQGAQKVYWHRTTRHSTFVRQNLHKALHNFLPPPKQYFFLRPCCFDQNFICVALVKLDFSYEVQSYYWIAFVEASCFPDWNSDQKQINQSDFLKKSNAIYFSDRKIGNILISISHIGIPFGKADDIRILSK